MYSSIPFGWFPEAWGKTSGEVVGGRFLERLPSPLFRHCLPLTALARRGIMPPGAVADTANRGRPGDVAGDLAHLLHQRRGFRATKPDRADLAIPRAPAHRDRNRKSAGVDCVRAANHLAQVLQTLSNPQQFPEVHALAVLKHLWVYIDRASAPDANATGGE